MSSNFKCFINESTLVSSNTLPEYSGSGLLGHIIYTKDYLENLILIMMFCVIL